MADHFVQLRVIHDKLPNLIELSIRVVHSEWSAQSTAYASPEFLTEQGTAILQRIEAPDETLSMETGADSGIGWMVVWFNTIDSAGYARCVTTLATQTRTDGPRPAETSRFAMELPTELGLIESFGQECIALGSDFNCEARLTILPVQLLPGCKDAKRRYPTSRF